MELHRVKLIINIEKSLIDYEKYFFSGLYAIAFLGPAAALAVMGYLTEHYLACVTVMAIGEISMDKLWP